MDKQTYLILLLSGQLTLLALDIRERLSAWREPRVGGVPPTRGVVFLVATVSLYAALQYGGLALAPSAEHLLTSARMLIDDLLTVEPVMQIRTRWGIGLIGVATFYFGGLCDYLLHRFVSHSRPLWFTHENHHLPTDVSVYMPGVFGRPFAVVAILPTMVLAIFFLQFALSVSGVQVLDIMPVIYTAVLAQAAVGTMSHSACLRRCGWIHATLKPLGLTTPQEHWLHHVHALGGNYGNFTTLWDRVFGTYLDPETIDVAAYRAGLGYDQDFLGTLTFGRWKLSERVRLEFDLARFCYLEPGRDAAIADAEPRPKDGKLCRTDGAMHCC